MNQPTPGALPEVVVVTVLTARNLRDFWRAAWRVLPVTANIRANSPGLLGSRTSFSTRARTLTNTSRWNSLDALRSMGRCNVHIDSVHMSMRHEMRSVSGVYTYAGHYGALLFGAQAVSEVPAEGDQKERDNVNE